MAIAYSEEYWNCYYGGSYEDTYMAALGRLKAMLVGGDYSSFCDVGCGPGLTLVLAKTLLPIGSNVYGVEIQDIPSGRRAPDVKIHTGNFLSLCFQLEPVDFLYVTCAMYIQPYLLASFVLSCLDKFKKTVAFANVYREDGDFIPDDPLRVNILESRAEFAAFVCSLDPTISYDPSIKEYSVFYRR